MAKRKTPPSQVDDSSMNSSQSTETPSGSTRPSQPGARRSRAGLPKDGEAQKLTEITEIASASAINMSHEPSEEEIRVRAYHLFLGRGRSHGNDFHDWLEAERELKTARHH
jgi:hypothetical protein